MRAAVSEGFLRKDLWSRTNNSGDLQIRNAKTLDLVTNLVRRPSPAGGPLLWIFRIVFLSLGIVMANSSYLTWPPGRKWFPFPRIPVTCSAWPSHPIAEF